MVKLIKGKYDSGVVTPPPPGDYPPVVISSNTQVAWDIFTGIIHTGPRIPTIPITALNCPDGWQIVTTGTNANWVIQSVTHISPQPLAGFDTGGRFIFVIHPNRIIRDCDIVPSFASPIFSPGIAISTSQPNIINTLVEYCNIDGGSTNNWTGGTVGVAVPSAHETTPGSRMACGIQEHASATGLAGTIVRYCRIGGGRDDNIKMRSANGLIERNYFFRGGYAGPDNLGNEAHYDCLDVSFSVGGVIIQDNFHNLIEPSPPLGVGVARGLTSSISVWSMDDVTNRRNIWHYGAERSDTLAHTPFYSGFSGTKNYQIYDNIIEWDTWALYPTPAPGPYGITVWNNIWRWSTETLVPYPYPGTFTLPTITAAAHNTVYTGQFTVTNFGTGVAISVTGGQWRKNGGALSSSPGTVSNGDVVDVLMNGPTALNSTATMTCTVNGVVRTMSVSSGSAIQSLLYFHGPHKTLAEEAALGGDWAAHKTLMDTYRVDNIRWLMSGVQNDPTLALYIRFGRGTVSDDKTDGDAYLDASGAADGYVADNSNLWNTQDNHRLAHSPAVYYLLNGTHLDWARAMVDNCEWQYEEASGPHTAYNSAAQYWTQRSMAKYFGSLVAGRWVGAEPGGSVGVVPGNYTGGTTQLAKDFLAQILAQQDSRGAWPMAYAPHSFTKPWQDSQILHHLILYHKNFDPLNDTLKAAILKCCEWLWCIQSQYSVAASSTFSTTSGKWTGIYMDKYDGDPDSGGAPDTLNGMADLSMFYMFGFAYAYFLTHDTTWRSRMRGILKAAVADAWYAGGAKWWGELSLGSMGSYYDGLVFAAPTFPICSVSPTGIMGAGAYTINSDGTWSGSPTATEYEIWHWKMQSTAGAIYARIATAANASVAGYSGDFVKGRVRKQNASGWGAWNDTAWTVVP